MKKELVYDDISLFSREISTIKSRFSQEINLTNKVIFGNKNLDMGILISAPMLDVSGEDLCVFLNMNNHLGVLHRFMSADEQLDSIKKIFFRSTSELTSFSVGIHDCKEKIGVVKTFLKDKKGLSILICIDTANGASQLLEEPIKEIKKLVKEFPDHNIEIMAGNIVTKEAAQWLYVQGVKFVRVGIGGGCFTPGTLISTSDGEKNIEDVKLGDFVYTHTSELKEVIDTMVFNHHEEIIELNNNEITCTPNHEFYVIKKQDQNKVTEDNIHDFAFWVKAEDLTDNFLLIELE